MMIRMLLPRVKKKKTWVFFLPFVALDLSPFELFSTE